MHKKYIVRLTAEEREHLNDIIKKLKGSGQKVRRAQIMLKADADGPNWTDKQISEAFSCRTKTVENIRQRFVEQGFHETLEGKKRKDPPTPKLLNGEQEAYCHSSGTTTAWLCQLDIASPGTSSGRIRDC